MSDQWPALSGEQDEKRSNKNKREPAMSGDSLFKKCTGIISLLRMG